MKTAIALGTFDGLHIAHRKVLELPSKYKKTAVTFKIPPKMYFSKTTELLLPFSDKCRLLEGLGFEEIDALEFEEVMNTEPTEFLELIYKKYNPSYISCGFNYRFGKGGAGDTALLKAFCDRKGICLNVCESITQNGEVVSSSTIRNMLKEGRTEEANSLLFEPFSFTAQVEKGDKRGRTIGFPTINQRYPTDLVKVKFGVYKTRVFFDGKGFDGITNIGIRPTFEKDYVTSETYIKDFSGDLYGKNVKIELIKFLREEKKFESLQELKKQIEEDIK